MKIPGQTPKARVEAAWKKFGDTLSRRLCLLNRDQLCAEARRRAGLEEFGSPPLEPAMSVLINSLENEADLHPLGRFLMRVHLRDLLETRLRLAQAWNGRLETLAGPPVQRPVFITGMPRSGSTFLHELLAEDPDNRAPRVWEVMYPVPAPEPEQNGFEPRIWKAEACLWWFRRFAPEADAVYPMRACTPHECVAIHSFTFLSEEFVSSCRIPTYEAFLRSANLGPAYAWQKRFLQHLQLGRPAKRWVLKSPDHARCLEDLFAIFPDAVVIQTHRNPLDVLRSSSHLTRVLQGLYARPVDDDQIGAREVRVLACALERLMRFRDLHPELANRFFDLRYHELVADPLAAVRRIYRHFEMPLTDAAAERMRRLVSSRSRYRKRHALPTLAELGLDVLAEARRFELYCSRFGVLAPAPN